MTFDDGVLKIYGLSDTALPGGKPVRTQTLKSEHRYHRDTLGVIRYYQAMQADQQISAVLTVPDWHDIKTTDVAKVDTGTEAFDISMIQTDYDQDGRKITRITLGGVSQSYAIETGQS